MTKTVLILLTVALFILAVGGWTYALLNRSDVLKKGDEIADHHTQATAQNVEWAAAQAKAQTTATAQEANWKIQEGDWRTAQEQLQTTSSAQAILLQGATEVASIATREAISQTTQIADLRHLSATQYLEIQDLEDTTLCYSRPPSIDYTSNATVSASLKHWLENTQENISRADWTVVWTGTETAIHYLQGKYYYAYVVYFDEPDYYYDSSIYDIYSHCFLDH